MRARARVVDGQLALWSPQWWPCRRGRPEADLADCIRKGLIRTGSYVAGTIQFLCPITGRRARVLYLPAGGGTVFASRQASRLAYRSQRASPEDRAIERSLKARKKLGVADQNMLDMPYCPRPKWMRDRTYRRLVGVTPIALGPRSNRTTAFSPAPTGPCATRSTRPPRARPPFCAAAYAGASGRVG